VPDPSRVVLPGSEHPRPAVGGPAGTPEPTDEISLTVYLRPRPGGGDLSWADDPRSEILTREQFAARHGSAEDDLAELTRLVDDHGGRVVAHDAGRRAVTVAGRLGDLATLFGAQLSLWSDGDSTYRVRQGPLQLPPALHGLVTSVFGFDQRPQARSQHRARPHAALHYSPVQVAERYGFPAGTDGTGQCVALIELGGGFRDADLDTYFSGLGVARPTVVAVGVDGATNAPGDPSGPDGEVMLDIEVVGAVAPAARVAVYFAPNTNQGFVDAVTTAVHDATNRPTVVSISWGGPESTWPAQALDQMEQAFQAAAALGVTVLAAAGDNGSTDGVADGRQHVDFPASAPHALACGGTTLPASGETVWNESATGHGATGGGISDHFPVPAYQAAAGVPPSANPGAAVGRGVPDVAGDADPETGYSVRVDGQDTVIGGTSAVAPLWAALIARCNQALGRPVGFAQPVLYRSPGAFTDIVAGGNGAYSARPGWDACTGLGSPRGDAVLQALRAAGA